MADNNIRFLLVGTSTHDCASIKQEMESGGHSVEVEQVATLPSVKKALTTARWDIIVSDYRLPRCSISDVLTARNETSPFTPVIMLADGIDKRELAEAMRSGVRDYLVKGDLSRLVPVVERELSGAAARMTRHQTEKAILQGKIEWEAAFDSVSSMIFLVTPQGTITRCNRQAIERFNTTYHELLGCNITNIFYGDKNYEGSIFTRPNETNNHEEDITFPLLIGLYNASCYSIQSTDKEHGHVYIVEDMTAQRAIEEEKTAAERELVTLYAIASRLSSSQSLQEVLTDLLAQLHDILQIDWSCIYLSKGNTLYLTASTGLSADAVKSLETLPNNLDWTQKCLEGKQFSAAQVTGHFSGKASEAIESMGTGKWFALPLKPGDSSLGALLVAQHTGKITSPREQILLASVAKQMAILIENHALYDEMKEKNEELSHSRQALKDNLERVNQANIELGRLNAAKSTFIGMASHELKTPLTSMIGGLQFLLKYSGLEMNLDQQHMMEDVYDSAMKLKSLAEDLLSVSRIELRGIEPQKQPVNLPGICQEISDTMQLPLSERDIVVKICHDDCKTSADHGLCKLAVRNLLENAIKFTPDGGEITVSGHTITLDELNSLTDTLCPFYPEYPNNIQGCLSFYRFDIIDTGIGIPAEERVRIFDKFYGIGDISYHSSGKTSFMSKGTGLGLFIVKGVMDAHGGLVWVTPGKDGKGSVFSLLFPLTNGAP